MYVVQASPFSKIFMPEWEQKCVENPELIAKSEQGLFEVRVPRSAGAIVLKHRVPVLAASLIPASKNRKVEDDEITPLVNWLTGGPEGHKCEETDIYGIVLLDVASDFQRGLSEILKMQLEASSHAGSAAQREAFIREQVELQVKVATEIEEKLKAATEKANERVRNALKHTHNNLLKSWESLKAQGMGTYTPSPQEALGYFIMKTEIDRALEQNRKLYNDVAAGIPGAQRA